ncbi:MAG TPA: hypothetical protein VN213_00725 [Solirubrobacteraceae bacterium]|nr:hypothetical protein [Solirubrobacteraceae bacterium]
MRATIDLLRRGDVLLIAGSAGYLAFDIATLAATFEALGGGRPGPPPSSWPSPWAKPAR